MGDQYIKRSSHPLYNHIDCIIDEECQYKIVFQNQYFCQTEYGIFYFYYSNSDHDFLYHVHGTRVFSELIFSRVIIQRTAFGAHFGYYELMIVFSEDQLLAVFIDLVDHKLR